MPRRRPDPRGLAADRRRRRHAVRPGAVVGVGGHTHAVEDERFELYQDVDIEGPTVRVVNPGSATGADPAERPTMMTAEVADGAVDVTLHER
ncbi:MAG: metallophosphoesterase family protein [Halolamina sp.]